MSTGPIHDVIERWHLHIRKQLPGGLDELLHDDVIFYSPVVFTPQRGKEITTMYLTAAEHTLGGEHFRYAKEVLAGDTAVLEFETQVDGKYVNGVDIIRCDEAGKIVEFRVMLRPLQAVNMVHQQMAAMLGGDRRRGIELFRGGTGPGLFESGTMSMPEFDPDDQALLKADGPRNRDIHLGAHDQVLFRGDGPNGYSLVRAEFAPHFVLVRHTHNADCLYAIVAGSLTMGAVTLVAGEGFFVPADAPYGYEAGPDGVVVLEFRTRTTFDMKIPGGQIERLRQLNRAAEEHGALWRTLRTADTANG